MGRSAGRRKKRSFYSNRYVKRISSKESPESRPKSSVCRDDATCTSAKMLKLDIEEQEIPD